MLSLPRKDVYINARDGLKLHGTYFPTGDEKKVVICFHGYTSEGMKGYIALSEYYSKKVSACFFPTPEPTAKATENT